MYSHLRIRSPDKLDVTVVISLQCRYVYGSMTTLQSKYVDAIQKQGKSVGKIIGSSIYLHRSAICSPLEQIVVQVCLLFSIAEQNINVIRIDRKASNISLLKYQDFTQPFPGLLQSHTIDLQSEKYLHRSYGKNGNHPILHRKELLLLRTHPNYNLFVALTEQAESYGLFTNLNKIGYRKYWNALIEAKGLVLSGHQFVPKEE